MNWPKAEKWKKYCVAHNIVERVCSLCGRDKGVSFETGETLARRSETPLIISMLLQKGRNT